MNKKIFVLGVIAICLSIILAALIMKPQVPPQRYTVVTSGNQMIVIDNETNQVYNRFVKQESSLQERLITDILR